MALKQYKPTSPSRRQLVTIDRSDLYTGGPLKSLTHGQSKSGGRNNTGRITSRRRGGGHRRRYRIIDFKRNRHEDIAEVMSIEYDPNRSAFIALTKFDDDEKRYIVALKGLKVGDKIVSGSKKSPDTGNCMPLSDIPLGTIISCIEMRPGKGAAIARSAGSFAQLMAKDGKFVTVKMPSGETRLILSSCYATIGSVSNSDHQLTVFGKAGSRRWLGRRPRTRPVAMNPVDHPMGGGEGRASGGHPRSKNGIPAKGFRTRDKKKASNKYIIERKKK